VLIEPARVNCTILEIGSGENLFEKNRIRADPSDLKFVESPLKTRYGLRTARALSN